jgi:hypothetical protein
MQLALSEWWHESHGRVPTRPVGPAELRPVEQVQLLPFGQTELLPVARPQGLR